MTGKPCTFVELNLNLNLSLSLSLSLSLRPSHEAEKPGATFPLRPLMIAFKSVQRATNNLVSSLNKPGVRLWVTQFLQRYTVAAVIAPACLSVFHIVLTVSSFQTPVFIIHKFNIFTPNNY